MSTNNDNPELWRSIPGFEGSYEVSSRGRVRSLDRTVVDSRGVAKRIRGRTLKIRPQPGETQRGYMQASLSRPGTPGRLHLVHRLVLEAFIGPCPDGQECCHNNDIPTDNRLENLRWDTRLSNMADRMTRVTAGEQVGYAGSTHCKRNHEFTPENTYLRPRGRECKACRIIHVRNFRHRKSVAA